MQKYDIKLDENWITPGILAQELDTVHSTITNWIKRNQIDYFVLEGVKRGKHLVDRRTAPKVQPKGWPKKAK